MAENLQSSGGLMHYHSAPSTLFASLLDDDLFSEQHSLYSQAEETELTRYLCGELPPSSLCDTKPLVGLGFHLSGLVEPKQSGQRAMVAEQSQFLGTASVRRGSLAAISEHGLEEVPVDSFNTCPLSTTANRMHLDHQSTGPKEPPLLSMINRSQVDHQCATDSCVQKKPTLYTSSLPHIKRNLIRHSSSPAEFLSRLAMEESGENYYADSYMHNMANGTFGGSKVDNSCSSTAARPFETMSSRNSSVSSSLLRQNSSPSSKLLNDVTANEKVSMSSPSWNSSEEGPFTTSAKALSYANHLAGIPDEAGTCLQMDDDDVFGQRKRGRGGLESTMLQCLPIVNASRCVPEVNTSQYSSSVVLGSESAAGKDVSLEDSVLCKARAKRGCATHPRSIAERVRRTKISDRMRKLQELVPQMDKQSSTAEMLDEAVEYIKLLQRQVQELSENRCKCSDKIEMKVSP